MQLCQCIDFRISNLQNCIIRLCLGFSCGSGGKEYACSVGDLGLIPGLRKSPGVGKSYPLQYSDLENSKDSDTTDFHKSQTKFEAINYSSNRYLSKKQMQIANRHG